MSTTGTSEQGTVYVLDEPDAIRRKFRRAVADSGREIVRREDKPGISNLIEIMAVARGTRPEEIEREFDGSGYGDFKTAVADAVVDWLAPVRSRYEELRAEPERARADAREGRRQGAGDRVRHARRRARGDGRRPAASLRPPGRLACRGRMATIAHRLELDLDVFAGPFDLLLSLVLREELDLLEVELAEVVLAYVDHLEAEGELDLEAATEFLVLIAALLELKSRLMLPGEELPDDLEGLGPAEAAEELLERMLQYARFRGAGGWVAEAHAAGRAYLHRSAPLPPALRQVSARARRARVRPRGAGAGDRLAAAHAAADRPAAHGGAARVRGGSAGGAAAAAEPRAVLVRRGGRGRRPRDGRGDAVRAARALQARRGRVGAARAVRADHDPRRGGADGRGEAVA